MSRRIQINHLYWEKENQGQGDIQGLVVAWAAVAVAAAETLELSSLSSLPSLPSTVAYASAGSALSSPAMGVDVAPAHETEPHAAIGTSHPGAQEGATSQDKQDVGCSQSTLPKPSAHRDLLNRKVNMLVESLPEKFKTKELITQDVLLKIVGMKYSHHFPELLRRTSTCMELVFRLELKEVDHRSHTYALVSKLGLADDGSLSGDMGLPTNGLLMFLLGMTFMKGNCAIEEEVWEFLNIMGVYAGMRHHIFGEPQRLITKELVQQKYLEYNHVPGSDPPRYEFLWGTRAHAENRKMRVLKVLAKIQCHLSASQGRLSLAFRSAHKHS
ncbi:melanoma-associated antigen B4-like [Manis pentadactyla]|uniref:melanoma-associated antigen B4-like n=1 Tax=Manis pentadactyla TaxID=143292 RepID=UPI00255C57CD|nr:melanoma-associated antigen B4-like [Manis pentadactyla]